MKNATEQYTNEQFGEAAYMYERIIKNNKTPKEDKQVAAFNAGEAYRRIHNPKSALKNYDKAIRYGVKDPIAIFRKAQMQKEMGLFQDAIATFKIYQKEAPSDERTQVMIDGCEAALKWKEEKSRYTVTSFKPANDSRADDFSPMWGDRQKKSILFTSDRESGVSKNTYTGTNRFHTDVWRVKLEGRGTKVKWTDAELVDNLNTKFNDGVMAFNKRMSKMYVTQCNGENGKEPTCKIYSARKVGKGFEMDPEPLSFTNDNKYNYGHPVLSPDDKTMYFVSDRPGGFGDTSDFERTKDIWMVKYVRRGRTWGEPINLGPAINTAGNEMFPYMHSDGTFIFSSDGHPGIGGLDLFTTKQNGEGPTDWELPKNMKSPMNSEGDDFGIIMEPKMDHGYFTSTRKRQQDDIYEFYMEPIVCELRGQVTDCDSGTALTDALVVISNNIDSTKIRLRTDSKGNYSTPITTNTEYTIKVSKRSAYYYDAEPQYVSTVGVENSVDCQHVKDFCMKNNCNDVFVLPIYYDLNQDYIRPDAEPILNDLINTLKKYPKMAVELGSHTDCRASYEYNRDLSQRRANSAVKYLIERGGINPFRLEAQGYGESQLVTNCPCEGPVKSDCSEDDHQKNRRTTVKVVNCNFDPMQIDYSTRNDAALGGRGSLYSPYLLEQQRSYLIKTKGNVDSFLNAKALADSLETAKAKEEAYLAKYDIIDLTTSRDKQYLYGYIGRKKIKFQFSGEDRRTLIPQQMVVQLLDNKTLKVDDFKDQGDKIKLPNGMKIYGKSFTLSELKIGDKTYKKVKCKMIDAKKQPVLGYNVFDKEYVDFEVKDGKIWLLKDDEEEE